MALLEELNSTAGADKFPEMYDKINQAIQTINAVLGGGAAGQFPAKIDSTDFNFEFIDQPILKTKIVNIGDWNMDTTSTLDVNHGVADHTKIRSVFVMILPDAEFAQLYPFSGNNTPEDGTGISYIDSSVIRLTRLTGGIFDNSGFNSTSFNRGYITIGYID